VEELKVDLVEEKLRRYTQISLSTTCNKTDTRRMPIVIVNYRLRRLERPLKRLLAEAETSLLKPES